MTMRDKNSKPVYRRMGTSYDPPDAGTTSRARKVIRTKYCKFTQVTQVITKAVSHSGGKGNDVATVRTTHIDRFPARVPSTGYHTREEKRAEAEERNAHTASLTVAQRIEKLDRLFGKGVGAVKERARLLNPRPVVAKVAAAVSGINQPHTTSEKMGRAVQHAQSASAITPAAKAYRKALAKSSGQAD